MEQPLLKGLATIGLLSTLLMALPAHAQAPATLNIAQVITSAYPDVTAVIDVRDATGAPLAGLTAADFSATEDGNPAGVTGVQAAASSDLGLAVVLVIDTSSEMAGEPLSAAQEAATNFVGALLPKDGAIVIPFADSAGMPSILTSDEQSLAATLHALQAGGSRALYDAVVGAAQRARTAPLPRRAVILLTDGPDSGNKSAADVQGSLDAAINSGVPFFTIGLGNDISLLYLQVLAGRTGGEFLAAPTPGDISAAFDQIETVLSSQYLVQLHLSAPANLGTTDLEVTVNSAGVSASGSTRFLRPSVVPTVTPQQPPQAAATTSSGSRPSRALLALAAALASALAVLLVAGAFATWRRRRKRILVSESGAATASAFAPPPLSVREGEPPIARLIVVDGPDKGKSVALGGKPVTLGGGAGCILPLANPDGRVGEEHARLWLREGHFMLHHLEGPRFATYVNERQVAWAALENGDEVVIGPHRLRFERLPQ